MSHDSAGFKNKVHMKKLKEHRDKDSVIREIPEKSLKEIVQLQMWDFEHSQLSRSKYSEFRVNLENRLKELPEEAERKRIVIALSQVRTSLGGN
jgi:hypothetical protein